MYTNHSTLLLLRKQYTLGLWQMPEPSWHVIYNHLELIAVGLHKPFQWLHACFTHIANVSKLLDHFGNLQRREDSSSTTYVYWEYVLMH